MDKPRGFAQPPVLEIPGGDVRQSFELADLSAVAAVRRWLREVLPADCLHRDDCVLVGSELAANVVEHSKGGRVSVALAHGAGRLRGVLLHHAYPTGLPKVQTSALLEFARLLAMPDGAVPDITDLEEEGRGLAVVASLCLGAWNYAQTAEGLAIGWELTGCVCTEGGLSC